jgi:hypothetical protein
VAFALLPRRNVKPLHVIAVVVWVLVLVAAHEVYRATSVITRVEVVKPDTPSVTTWYRVTQGEGAAPRVDLYGNEVHEAVGDYRVDRRGELYERHAPDTAVLRLRPPGT